MYNMQAVCTNIRDLRQESTTRPSARPRRQHKTFLGLSTSAVPTMGGKYSLVDTFWIVYQIGQMFGCFPYKTGQDKSTNICVTQPIHFGIKICLMVLAHFCILIVALLGGWILKSTTRAPYLEIITAMTIDINESFWDQTSLAMVLVSYVILQCEDFYCMDALPNLHLYYASMMGRLIKEKPLIKRKIVLFFYILLFFGVIGFVVINIGFSLRLAKALDTTFPCVLTIFLSATVFHLLLALPTVIQAALFGEFSGNLCLWIEVLGDNILKNDMPCLLLRDCWKLHQGTLFGQKILKKSLDQKKSCEMKF